MSAREEILAFLDENGIHYDLVTHPPVHTIEDCIWAEKQLGCVVPKNLFLTPRNQSFYALCLTRPSALFRTADFSKQIGSSRLSFGGPEALMEKLLTAPGAVSPLGLIFPSAAQVPLYLDEQLKRLPRLGFHPNDNTATLAMATEDFLGASARAEPGAAFSRAFQSSRSHAKTDKRSFAGAVRPVRGRARPFSCRV
jgi:Ala-tRNA(Pro) deacylase